MQNYSAYIEIVSDSSKQLPANKAKSATLAKLSPFNNNIIIYILSAKVKEVDKKYQ